MIKWFDGNNYIKKEINIDNYNYNFFTKEKVHAEEKTTRIIVVSYQPNKEASELLRLCIESIKKFTDTDYELWIVDNNSPEELIKWLEHIDNINIIYKKTK